MNKASCRHVCSEVCKLKSRALSHEPSSDCVIAPAKGRVRAQASYGNITVSSHLNPGLTLTGFRTARPWFGDLQEVLNNPEVQLKNFSLPVKTSCPPA